MGFLSKLQFWKKDEFDDFGGDLSKGMDPGLNIDQQPDDGFSDPLQTDQQMHQNAMDKAFSPKPDDNFQAAPPYPQSNPTFNQPSFSDHNKDIEIISSKIDALRAVMESINQRMSNLEHYMREERQNKYKW